MEIPNPENVTLPHNPFFDNELNLLFYSDLFAQPNASAIFCYDPHTAKIHSAVIKGEGAVSFFIPIKECNYRYKEFNKRNRVRFAVGLERSVKIIDWDCRSPVATVAYTLFAVEQQPKYARNIFHQGKVDPTKKRLYAGTYRLDTCGDTSAANASFYRFDCEKGVTTYLKDDIKISSGLDWNPLTNEFYHVESCQFSIYGWKWNARTGDLSK